MSVSAAPSAAIHFDRTTNPNDTHGSPQPAAPQAGHETLTIEGFTFSSNPAHTRFVLERVVAERMLSGGRDVVAAARSNSGADSTDGAGAGANATAPGVAGVVEREFFHLSEDADRFLTGFEHAGRAEIIRMLDASEATVRG